MTDRLQEVQREFQVAVQEAIGRNASLEEFAAILRFWREHGLTAKSASTNLELLRDQYDEESEDRLLEILDIVAGHCQPALQVWN